MKARALLLGMVAVCAGLIAFVFVQFRGADGGDGGSGGVGVRVGVPHAEADCREGAADCLPRVTFLDTAGDVHTPDALAGKVVVVNFWATWCRPCLAEIPDLAALHRRYEDKGLVMLGVMTDAPDDAALAAFVARHGLSYPIVRADDELQRAFGAPDALPTTFVYDRRGHVRYARPGAVSRDGLDELLAELTRQ